MILQHHLTRSQHQPSCLAEQRIERELRSNRRSIHGARAVPVRAVGVAIPVPPAAGNRRVAGIQAALVPQKERRQFAFV